MASEKEKTTSYYLPPNLYVDWNGYEEESFGPTVRQQLVMRAHEAAIAAGHIYSNDVKSFATDYLKVPEELRLLNKYKVVGGDVGYDIYYAGKAVNAANRWKARTTALKALQPLVGMPIGTLRLMFKRTTKCVILKISGHNLVVIGQRGHQVVTFTCDIMELQNASIAAFEKGWRKSPLIKTD